MKIVSKILLPCLVLILSVSYFNNCSGRAVHEDYRYKFKSLKQFKRWVKKKFGPHTLRVRKVASPAPSEIVTVDFRFRKPGYRIRYRCKLFSEEPPFQAYNKKLALEVTAIQQRGKEPGTVRIEGLFNAACLKFVRPNRKTGPNADIDDAAAQKIMEEWIKRRKQISPGCDLRKRDALAAALEATGYNRRQFNIWKRHNRSIYKQRMRGLRAVHCR